jgi:hypothetical protein
LCWSPWPATDFWRQELERLRADLHRFEITLASENKEWKVVRAEWRRAEPGDFY